MEITVRNSQKIKTINPQKVKRYILKLAGELSVVIEDISLLFCEDSFLQELNYQYFKKNVPTDVIAFPFEEFSEKRIVSGEILISVQRAYEQAAQYGNDVDREVYLYVTHGFLHLMGHSDKPAPAAEKMRRLQEDLLNRLYAP